MGKRRRAARAMITLRLTCAAWLVVTIKPALEERANAVTLSSISAVSRTSTAVSSTPNDEQVQNE